MSENTAKTKLPSQFTIRLGEDEMDYINENLHLIIGEDIDVPRSRIFVKAITKAVQNTKELKPKEIPVDNPELLKEIENLKARIDGLTESNNQLETIVADFQEKETENKHAIVLNLKPNLHKYFWAVMQIAKKQQYANTYEELLSKIMETFKARKEFMLDADDINYLKTLEYDGPTEN